MKLGVTIDPSQVRLQPDTTEGYIWVRQPDKEYLFTKPLSKHSIGAYMELCREVGRSFEAVAHWEPANEVSGDPIKAPYTFASLANLTSKSSQLQAENEKMAEAVSQYKDKAHAESLARQRAEEMCGKLDRDLSAARIQEGKLKRENINLSSKVRQLRRKLRYSDIEVKKALTVLYRLAPGTHTDDEDADPVEDMISVSQTKSKHSLYSSSQRAFVRIPSRNSRRLTKAI
ncbi:uncharacterized protein Z518_11055 [Rhinocladiella mackenziei CBS 650.93]|uniref:Uncharacterized protein n=1 Tax=Rhinocladiella mackenziei CBS 650.93 TaxID=1442369 RepID=A0A0D2GMQ6_9EURO|nr:uncharacterized protein Z518_11055 [Rhinocladiella mackenziei CBS 650.93]KIW99642.1 hypothetical protein Z518_11055 [Rhinocladiella mackenziei CBS 650.93]